MRTLEEMRDYFSMQAKVAEAEKTQIEQIGSSLQSLSLIDFNDTYQVVLNKKGAKGEDAGGIMSDFKPSGRGGSMSNLQFEKTDSESSGDATGSTEYEVI